MADMTGATHLAATARAATATGTAIPGIMNAHAPLNRHVALNAHTTSGAAATATGTTTASATMTGA